jgi:glycosyltransferase involved in cell wall biosynthesis
MAKVSVIIPTYNRAGIIDKTLFSVIRQTISDIEIIAVDDGSTDNTCEVVKKIGDSRIKYFYKENGGVSSARNLGLTKAGGEYIAFLDSDDLWQENYLECMISALENHTDYGAAYSPFRNKLLDGTEKD